MPGIDTALVALIAVTALVLPARPQEPNTSVRQVVTAVGTVDRIDVFARTLTLRSADGAIYTIHVSPELTLFNELRTGDKVSVRLSESVIVAVRPGAKPSVPLDTTAGAAASDPSGRSEVIRQIKAAVTVESIDRQTNMVVYKTADNRRVVRGVADPRLLNGVAPGDVIEITYSRERALDLQRVR